MKPLIVLWMVGGLLGVLPASGHAIQFTTVLNGANEFPANASPATGLGEVSFDTSTHTLSVSFSFSGLVAGTTAAHIHCCVSPSVPTFVAGVASPVPFFPGFPIGVTSGSYSNTFDTAVAASFNPSFISSNGGTVASAEAALAAGMLAGNAYLNIHTSAFPGGEIRGFLQPTQPVPEPSTHSLIAVGSLAFLFLKTRRSQV